MVKALLSISAIITLLTGYLAFSAKGKIDATVTDLKSTRADKARLTTDNSKLKTDLKKSTDDLTAANEDIKKKEGQIAKGEMDLTAAKADLAKATEATEQATKDLAAKSKELEDIKVAMNRNNTGDTPASPQVIEDMQKQIATLQTAVKEQTAIADSFKQKSEASERTIAQQNTEIKKYRDNIQRPGVTGRVVAVNQGWNFVVIDVGDRRGATMSAPLLVTRGGQQVARARVTSVEPGTSIADIIPGSLARGQYVQPGDTVIFAGRQPAPADQNGGNNNGGGAAPNNNAPLPSGGGTAQLQ